MNILCPGEFGQLQSHTLYQLEVIRFPRLLTEEFDLSDACIVITPLFGDGFDAIDVLDHLEAAKFKGVLRVIAPKLSNYYEVLMELRLLSEPVGIMIDLYEGEISVDASARTCFPQGQREGDSGSYSFSRVSG